MNRQKRRELARTMNTPQKLEQVVNKVVREREKELQEIHNQKLLGYTEVMVFMTAYVLDLEEIDKERIPGIMNRILMNIDSFRTGQLKSDDFQAIKKDMEELGVKF